MLPRHAPLQLVCHTSCWFVFVSLIVRNYPHYEPWFVQIMVADYHLIPNYINNLVDLVGWSLINLLSTYPPRKLLVGCCLVRLGHPVATYPTPPTTRRPCFGTLASHVTLNHLRCQRGAGEMTSFLRQGWAGEKPRNGRNIVRRKIKSLII